MSWLVAGPHGNFPNNDDWIYAGGVKSIVTTGRFQIPGSNAFNFIPIHLAAMLCTMVGFSYPALRCVSIFFHILGVAGLYLSLRECRVSSGNAGILSSIYAFSPFLLNLSLSFMTDVPALAMCNWTIYFVLAAINRKSLRLFLVSMLALTAAMAIRQTSLVLLPPVLIAALLSLTQNRQRLLFLTSLMLPAVSFVLLQRWLADSSTTAAQGNSQYSQLLISAFSTITPLNLAETFSKAACYVGLFLLPITIPLFFALPFKKGGKLPLLLSSIFSTVLLATLINVQRLGSIMPYFLNLFFPPILGCYGLVGGVSVWKTVHVEKLTYFCDAMAVCWLFTLVFSVCGIKPDTTDQEELLLVSRRKIAIILILFCTAAGTYLQLLTSAFDRYLLAVLAPCIITLGPLWQRVCTIKLQVVSTVLSIAVAAYGVIAAMDVMNFSRSQLSAITFLEQRGISADRIDAGPAYTIPLGGAEFSKAFKQGIGWPESMRGKYSPGSIRWWPVISDEFIIASVTLEGYEVVRSFTYWSPLSWKNKTVYVLKSKGN
jgi:hypothetical protein